MIAADTSAWIDFSKGIDSPSARLLEKSLAEGNLVLPSPVLFEILSGPGLTREAESFIRELPRLDPVNGFWERAGELRKTLLKKNLKARGMDCLIAQNCMDYDVPLISSDPDFRRFADSGLKLLPLSRSAFPSDPADL